MFYMTKKLQKMYYLKLYYIDFEIGEMQKREINKGKYVRKLFVRYVKEKKSNRNFITSMG